ncbi:hypothetical protein BOCO_0655 [Bombiscardovia coagulans]|uniref:Uncharacterized protein n=1 Tax=Bombiscardovia coagulans TaxID=686666 RepID=A0A261ETF7_9BIFI|nr:hypothetical protein BOCO_0655 [Bombiscardovia coagulans]
MHGEHSLTLPRGGVGSGSSPHARGTRGEAIIAHTKDGIIPACTGNTAFKTADKQLKEDHPRMHGEHISSRSASFSPWGSSPHARGTPSAESPETKAWRIIPACTGNTQGKN